MIQNNLSLIEMGEHLGLPMDREAYLEDQQAQIDGHASWPIKILTWIGAWIGAGLFTAFLFLAEIYESQEAMLFVGIAGIAAAIFLSRKFPTTPVAEPLSLALNVLGIGFLAGAIGIMTEEFIPILLAGILVSVALLWLSPSSIQKFLAVLLFNFCLAGLIWDSKVYDLIHAQAGVLAAGLAIFYVEEPVIMARYKRLIPFINPVSFGFLISLFSILALSVNRDWFAEEVSLWWLNSLFMIGSLLYIVDSVLQKFGLSQKKWIYFVLILLALAPTIFSPGLSASIMVIVLGLYRGQRFILALGIAGLAYFMGAFYYNLNTTLLIKSISLMVAGLLVLTAAWGLRYLRND